MSIESYNSIVEDVFSKEANVVLLDEGQTLMKEGDFNLRLFYVRSGKLVGYHSTQTECEVAFVSTAGDLLGVRSFFSSDVPSQATVLAAEKSELSFITLAELRQEHPADSDILLLSLLADTLTARQKTTLEIVENERKLEKEVQELEHFNLLGQFSAGVAHELNNALAVIVRGSEWIAESLDRYVSKGSPEDYIVFSKGMKDGRMLNSQEARKRTRELQKAYGFSFSCAKRVSQMDLDDETMRKLKKAFNQRSEELGELWEMGATFLDLRNAAEQAGYVVESMKNLGARSSLLNSSVDLVDTIRSAMSILRNVTKGVRISIDIKEDAIPISANKGELVQIWVNLVKNACQAMRNDPERPADKEMALDISAETVGDNVIIRISDNGPGIPEMILPDIFLPSFTTKKEGLNFGLGLGLPIVQKIINSYGGVIEASNTPDGALFLITLPQV